MRPHHRRGARGPGFAVMLLAAQMARVGFDKIPPVTLVAIVGQVVAYLKLLNIRWPSISEVCISPVNVWYKQEIERMFLSAVFHADEWHLYFNMVSFLWKGLKLEPRVGSGYFLYMLVVFTALTNAVYVGLGLGAEHFLHDTSYLSSCAVGFSGVLFALKVVNNHMSPGGVQRIMGFIPVSSQYACWAELVLIHIMVPRASFLGHLSGILVGLCYTQGPLKSLMDCIIAPNPTAHNYARPSFSSFFRSQPSESRHRDWGASRADTGTSHNAGTGPYNTGTGPYNTGGVRPPPGEDQPYTGGMTEDEQMQHALRESLRQDTPHTRQRPEPSAPPSDPSAPPYPTDGPPYPSHDSTGPPYPSHDSTGPPYPSADGSRPLYPTQGPPGDHPPPAYGSIYPDLSRMDREENRANHDMEELRRRRLQRFN